MRNALTYPAEITLKSIYYRRPETGFRIDCILAQRGISATVTSRASRNEIFVSYTITAFFESADHLEELCQSLSSLDGFLMIL